MNDQLDRLTYAAKDDGMASVVDKPRRVFSGVNRPPHLDPMELAGALSNLEAPVKWRALDEHRRLLLSNHEASVPQAVQLTNPAPRRVGWVWRGLQEVLAASPEPLTPGQARERLELKIGSAIAASTVKDCLRRHATAGGELRKYKGGKYTLRHRRSQ